MSTIASRLKQLEKQRPGKNWDSDLVVETRDNVVYCDWMSREVYSEADLQAAKASGRRVVIIELAQPQEETDAGR